MEPLEVHTLGREKHNSKSYLTKEWSPLATARDGKFLNKICLKKKKIPPWKVQQKKMDRSFSPGLSYKNQELVNDSK